MTIHFKTKGGAVRAGQLNGLGEVYHADEKGNGEIYKGTFIRGKLNDSDGTYIMYTNSSFTYFTGTFIDNNMDGHIDVIAYTTLDDETDDEKKCEGNSHCKSNNRRFIYASENTLIMECRRKTIIYSNGVQGSTISDISQNVTIDINQTCLNGRKLFDDFCVNYL
jgi:hypothetical protein